MAADGYTPIKLELPSLAPPLVLEILPKGLTLHKLYVQADGRTHDILVGPEDPTDHAHFPYSNTLIGRYTNRVPVRAHAVSRQPPGFSGAVEGALAPVAHPASTPGVSLHGGPAGLDARVFARLTAQDPPTLFSDAERASIAALPAAEVWAYTSPAGDQGFPGTLRVEVLTALLAPESSGSTTRPDEAQVLGSVLLLYRAKVLEADIATPVNLTQHWGFNLDASLNARRSAPAPYPSDIDTVKAHTLAVAADAIIDLDGDALSSGKLQPTAGGAYDFAGTGKRIGDRFPDKGYDEFWAFERPTPTDQAKHRISDAELSAGIDVVKAVTGATPPALTPAATLAGAKSGLSLRFYTNQGGVQFWSGNSFDRSNARKRIHGGTGVKGTGDGYCGASGAFLEFHEPLAAYDPANAGTVRNGFDTVIGPQEVYNNWVRADVLARSVPEEEF